MGAAVQKQRKSIFPYLVVATGIAGCFGPCAMALNCAGIYFTPVSEALGASRASFALYLTIMMAITAVILPVMGKFIEKYDLRIVLSVGVVSLGVPQICMSFFNAVWQFYIAGAIMGIGLGLMLLLAVPTLINRWFVKNVGFYIGLCMAFTGIGGVIFNLLGGYLIAMGPDGWRTGYLVFGIITLVIALPFTLFCVRSRPEDIGMKPVGYGEIDESAENAQPEEAATGVTASRAMKSSAFYILAAAGLLVNLGVNFYQYLPSYASSLTQYPDVVAASATLASVAMLGQAIGKVLIGVINDKAGVRSSLLFSTVLGIVGLAIALLIPGSVPLILCGGFAFGVFYASATVFMPLITRTIFGTREYSTIYSRIATAGSVAGAVAVTFWGFMVDFIGFSATFVVMIVVVVLVIVTSLAALAAGKRLKEEG